MKFINIDAEFMVKYGLTLEQASFFCYLRESLSWADDVVLDNVSYKWVSRVKVVSDIPYITDKTDTVYRWFLMMEKLGLIEYKKSGGKDLFRMTDRSKKWNSFDSDQNPNNSQNSDHHPNKLGSPSESNSDHHPTYSNIIIHSNTKDSNTYTASSKKERKPREPFTPPTEKESIDFFLENGFSEKAAKEAHGYYTRLDWKDRNGSAVKNWKQKYKAVWFREENKAAPKHKDEGLIGFDPVLAFDPNYEAAYSASGNQVRYARKFFGR